jgi:hypothetical protein
MPSIVPLDLAHTSATNGDGMGARVIHENTAHGGGRNGNEMRATPPVDGGVCGRK